MKKSSWNLFHLFDEKKKLNKTEKMASTQSQSGISGEDYSYVNEDQIDSELKCIICQQPFIEPLVGKSCGHTFCSICINNWFKQNSSCPSCRKKTSFEPVKTRVVLSQLSRLLVRCLHCNQNNIERANFDDHIQYRCSQIKVKCDAHHLNCLWTGTRQQYSQHSTVCPLLQVKPIIDQLKSEVAAQGYQLQIFMNEMREELNHLRNDRNSSKQSRPITANSVQQTGQTDRMKDQYNQIINDMKHTWQFGNSNRFRGCLRTCNFCMHLNERFFRCLVCSCEVVRANVGAHDSSSRQYHVICRSCVEKNCES